MERSVPSRRATWIVNTTEPGVLASASFLMNGKQYVSALFSNTLTDVPPAGLNLAPLNQLTANLTIRVCGSE